MDKTSKENKNNYDRIRKEATRTFGRENKTIQILEVIENHAWKMLKEKELCDEEVREENQKRGGVVTTCLQCGWKFWLFPETISPCPNCIKNFESELCQNQK